MGRAVDRTELGGDNPASTLRAALRKLWERAVVMRCQVVCSLTVVLPSIAAAQAPVPLWDISFGNPWTTSIYAAGSDLGGGVYVAGTGATLALLNRFSSTGELIWSRSIAAPNTHTIGYGLSATPEAVFIAGRIMNAGTPPYDLDVFLSRVSHDGEQVWLRRFGTSVTDYASDVCSDGSGGVYIVGDTSGSLGGPNAGSRDGFIARYDGDGNQLWMRQFGTAELDNTTAALPDGAGGVYIAGATPGALGPTLHGGLDCWLARYDSSGERLWIRQFGTFMSDGVMDLCSDGEGGLYAAGWTFGNFGGPANGSRDAIVARLTADGEIIWARQLGTLYPERAESVSPDGRGGVYVFGYTSGPLAGPYLGGTGDLFLAHYNPSGQLQWIRQLGSDLSDYSGAAAPDASGGVYISGHRHYSTNGGSVGTLARFPGCYANCDDATHAPLLTVADFACFLQKFAAADSYANCDNSNTPPLLNILDFACFMQKFAAGCP